MTDDTDTIVLLPLLKGWSESARQAAAEARAAKAAEKREDKEKRPARLATRITNEASNRVKNLPPDHPERREYVKVLQVHFDEANKRYEAEKEHAKYGGKPSSGGNYGDREWKDMTAIASHYRLLGEKDPFEARASASKGKKK